MIGQSYPWISLSPRTKNPTLESSTALSLTRKNSQGAICPVLQRAETIDRREEVREIHPVDCVANLGREACIYLVRYGEPRTESRLLAQLHQELPLTRCEFHTLDVKHAGEDTDHEGDGQGLSVELVGVGQG